ncbi:MAG: cupin domain-containing protein [Betaproteobacteria bacterium]|jgi:quercetin dioxygenase-like cupin family protein
MPVRRVVVGHNQQGKSVVISDGIAPSIRTNPARPGHISNDLWKTGELPYPLHPVHEDPTLGPRQIHPPKGGTIIRIAEIAPETDEIKNMSPDKAQEVFKNMGNQGASTFGRGGRHPMMHRTQTIDYAICIEGEITMLLDEAEVELRAGDVLIQLGTNHAWSNRSSKVAKMLYVLIDGQFDDQMKQWFEGEEH